MLDLFEEEQRVYDAAKEHIQAVDSGEPFEFEKYRELAAEYQSLLKLLRRLTKLSDRTAIGLNKSNLDLTDKVQYDTLTGIHSRRYMNETMEKRVVSLASSGGVLSVMMIDIDYFKYYNDTYGHSAGDDCLKAVAGALAGCVTGDDGFVARYGGEEFVAVLPLIDEAGAAAVAQEMLETVSKLGILHEKNEAADHVTISIGGTSSSARADCNFMDYIRKADEALYKSKQNGRNRYTYIKYEEELV